MPKMVFSAEYLSANSQPNSAFAYTIDLSNQKYDFYDEAIFSTLLEGECEVGVFANSFLIEARK